MANSSEAVVPLQELNQPEILSCKTPPLQNHQKDEKDIDISIHQNEDNQQNEGVENSSNHIHDFCKCKVSAGLGTPDRLKLPKPLKFAERYTSPTDHMMSPISKGLLARKSRKGARLPPSIIQSKIQELQSPKAEQIQLQKEQ